MDNSQSQFLRALSKGSMGVRRDKFVAIWHLLQLYECSYSHIVSQKTYQLFKAIEKREMPTSLCIKLFIQSLEI